MGASKAKEETFSGTIQDSEIDFSPYEQTLPGRDNLESTQYVPEPSNRERNLIETLMEVIRAEGSYGTEQDATSIATPIEEKLRETVQNAVSLELEGIDSTDLLNDGGLLFGYEDIIKTEIAKEQKKKGFRHTKGEKD